MDDLPRAANRPCGECPWRRDQPAGRFPPERYRQLADTSMGGPGEAHPGLYAPLFACHKSAEGREIACAGWLAVEGRNHVGVRLLVAVGRIAAWQLSPVAGWPELFGSFEEMAAANGVDNLPVNE